MAHEVNPPPQIRIPDVFFKDKTTRSFFERLQEVIWQLWLKTGGPADLVSGKQAVISVTEDITLDNLAYSALYLVDTSAGAVTVTLPPIAQDNIGESIDISVVDATNDVTVEPKSGTVLGDTSVILTQQYMSIQFTVDSLTSWIGT